MLPRCVPSGSSCVRDGSPKGEDQRSGASAQPTARSRRETPDRPSRSRIFRDFTCPREGGALSSQTEKGRLCRSEAKASRQSRDRLKRHPQEGQHSAAAWRDPGPSASGERHVIARGDRSRRPRPSLAARFTRARPAEPDAKRHFYSQFAG